MPLFTPEEIKIRDPILYSQPTFGKYLTSHIVNVLIHLFDNKYDSYIPERKKIIKYIEYERKFRKLDTSTISIKSEVYNENRGSPDLYIGIYKNGEEFIHLTIHLTLQGLTSDSAGMIHFSKNIYRKMSTSKKIRKKLYALISVSQPISKPNSLEFTLTYGKDTNFIPNNKYDLDIQNEMDVIITVLNRIFNEDDKIYYIGNEIFPVHNKTNIILGHINRHNSYFTRKNRGVSAEPMLNNQSPFINITSRRKTSKNTKRITRKSAVGYQPYIPDRT